ncbi:MAG: hypothetical protein CSA15_10725 [Candidatus Delongbacteria bacterium]|nr:MAG: hypothetical protein CSA15_10725 [Candidatus Delongbacteria bacterium]
MENEIIHKELDLIQGVINRMANNSFLLKGWLISLITVILALSKDSLLSKDLTYLSITLCLPVVVFWYLDAFFLHKERCYRKLYEWVIQNRKQTDEYLYSLNYSRFKNKVNSIGAIMFSKTLIPFYGLTMLILIGITLYNFS